MSSLTDPTIGSYRSYDAVVVGARPAGAATAMLLARAGRHVLLVDRSEYGRDTISTHSLTRGAVVQLHRWGLLDAVREAGTPAIRRAVLHYGDEAVDVKISGRHGVDALYAPRRTLLDPIIVDAAWNAGVEVEYGVRVVDMLRDDAGRVCGIRAETSSGDTATATAPIVIGADGARSTIAALVGAEDLLVTVSRSAMLYGYYAGLESSQSNLYYRPGVSAAVVPTNDGLANVAVTLPTARFLRMRGRGTGRIFRAVLADAAPQLAKTLASTGPVSPFRSFAGHRGYLRRAAGPGWALVGDAGYFKDPLTSHGITDALRDAELLARALLETRADAPDARAYQAERDALSIPFLNATAEVAGYGWNLQELRAIHMRLKRAQDIETERLAQLDERKLIAA